MRTEHEKRTAPEEFCKKDKYGEYTDLRTMLKNSKGDSLFASNVTPLERLMQYKRKNEGYELDNCESVPTEKIFKPVADIYEMLWDDVKVYKSNRKNEMINSGETIISSNWAFYRAKVGFHYNRRGGYTNIEWKKDAVEFYKDDNVVQTFAHAVATIGNFIPVPGVEQKMLIFLGERFDKELQIIKAYYLYPDTMKDSLPETICKWLNSFREDAGTEENWKNFVDKNYLKGSFTDENYGVVPYDNSLEQLTEMIHARSRIMLEKYTNIWNEKYKQQSTP